MATRTVSVALQAKISGFVTGMKSATKAANDFSSKLLTAADKNSQHLNTMASNLGILGAGLTGFAALAVKKFADFDQAMSHVQAATHASAEDMKLLRDAALEAGARTAFSATESANAIEELSKAGVSTADVLSGGLNGALDLAAAGSLGVAEAAEIAASAMVQFGLSGADLPHVADLLAAGAGKAQGSVQDMGLALKYVGPIAAGMGISIEQTAGAIALLASNGIIGEQAGTSLRGMLSSLTSPSKAAAQEMKNLGINVYDAAGNFVGFDGVAALLKGTMGDLTNAERDAALGIIFGNEQLTAARVLYKGGAAAVQDWQKEVTDSGYATETAALKMDNLKGDLEKLSGSFDTFLTNMGEGSNGALRGFVQQLEDVVDGLDKMSPAAKTATLAIVGGGGLALLGAAGLIKLVTTLGEAKVAMDALGLSAAKAATIMKFAGVAVALGGVAYAGTQLTKVMDDIVGTPAVDNLDAMGKALLRLGKNGQVSGALVEAFGNDFGGVSRKFIADGDSFAEAADRLVNATWVDKLEGGFDAAGKSIETMDKGLATLVEGGHMEEAQQAFRELAIVAQEKGVTFNELKGIFPQYAAALDDASLSSEEATEALEGTGTALEGAGAAAQVAKDPLEELSGIIEVMESRAKELDTALKVLNGTMDNVDAESNYEAAIDAIIQRQKDFKKELKDGGPAVDGMRDKLDLTTQAGRDNAASLRTLWQRAGEYATQIYKTTGDQREANRILKAGREQLVTMTAGFLGSQAAAEKYVTETLGIPKDVSSKWSTPGLSGAVSNSGQLLSNANRLDGKRVDTYFKTKFTEIHERITSNKTWGSPGKMAVGGIVRGPGTSTSDSVPMWLSDGEFVINAAATSKFRPLLEAINQGKSLAAKVPRFSGKDDSPFVRLGEVTDEEWEALLREGWQGRAGDHMEALYPPLRKLGEDTSNLADAFSRAAQAASHVPGSIEEALEILNKKVTAEDGSKVPSSFYMSLEEKALAFAKQFGYTAAQAKANGFIKNFVESYNERGKQLPGKDWQVFEDGSYRPRGLVATGQRLDLGEIKAGRQKVMTSAAHSVTADKSSVGDTFNVAVNAQSVDINERNLQSVTHAARLRARVRRPR